MKLFFASDIHGSLPAAQQAVEQFILSGANTMILLGDILNHGPRNPVPTGYNPPEVATLLNQFASQIIAVRGNCDSEVDQMLLTFPMMSDFAWVLLPTGARMFLTHGHLYHDQQLPPLQVGDVFVHGHTHIARAEYRDGLYLLNPGSVTFPRNNGKPSFAILDGHCFTVLSFSGQVLATVDLESTLHSEAREG